MSKFGKVKQDNMINPHGFSIFFKRIPVLVGGSLVTSDISISGLKLHIFLLYGDMQWLISNEVVPSIVSLSQPIMSTERCIQGICICRQLNLHGISLFFSRFNGFLNKAHVIESSKDSKNLDFVEHPLWQII